MSSIIIRNVKAISHFEMPIPEGGGVVVFKGTNGIGKSTAIQAVEAVATNRGTSDLEPSDGAASGSIIGLGVRISIGRKNTRTGELVCTAIDGKLSIEDLVDPGIQNPTSADAKRIKTLIQIYGIKACLEMFRPAFETEEEFKDTLKSEEIEVTDDFLVFAERVKRAIDKAALAHEGKSNTEAALAASCASQAKDVDINAECDSLVLQQRFEAAIRIEQQAKAEQKSAAEQNARIEQAQTALDMIAGTDAGKVAEQAKRELESAQSSATKAIMAVQAARVAFENAERELVRCEEEIVACQKAYDTSQKQVSLIESYRKTLADAGAAAVPPTEEYLSAVADEVKAAREACDQGAVVRQAKKKLEDREQHLAKASEYTKKALSLRGAAGNIDTVLSKQITDRGGALFVEKGRLVTKTHRGTELFADLSDGEKWKLAIDVAIDAVGPNGLITAGQPCWDGFSDAFRTEIADHLKARGAVLVTAQITNDPVLTAEVV